MRYSLPNINHQGNIQMEHEFRNKSFPSKKRDGGLVLNLQKRGGTVVSVLQGAEEIIA